MIWAAVTCSFSTPSPKFDGSQIRAEWSRKRGWYKFGTRRRLFNHTDPEYGKAIDIFVAKYEDAIPRILTDELGKNRVEGLVVYGEFFGPSSFAGKHDFSEDQDIVVFDVSVHKRGFVLPQDFVRLFADLPVAPVVYDGDFSPEFIAAVQRGDYVGEAEGVVVKGVDGSKKKAQHALWMCKVKTQWWLDELRRRAATDGFFAHQLQDNEKEQAAVNLDT